MLEIIRQLAQEFGVAIIIDERADVAIGDFKFEMAISRSVPPGTMLMVGTEGAPLWLLGLADDGQLLSEKSPALRYNRVKEELKDKQ